ncbi:MAG: xanthine dehydrogenase family protein molybdopterin-binding subunit [Leadbetterella sp.]|nr:xanthine dehydrogenase family protein molybdopterin-binding subunit [Leadbetterella sp.]
MKIIDTCGAPPPADGRVEAREKVTGSGKYAAEYPVEEVCYGVFAVSTLAAGKLKSVKVEKAKEAEGVIEILTHLNKPVVSGFSDETKIRESRLGLAVFHTDRIFFKGQPIALVVARTLEEATYAASLVEGEYEAGPFELDFDKARRKATLASTGREKGSPEAWSQAAATVEAEYTIAAEIHNPMEMHATIAHWVAADRLKLYDKNQGVNNVQRTVGRVFEIPAENIEVFSEFVGGGFGSGLRVWSNTLAAAMAAKMVKRPVKLMLTRPQMFMLTGYRPASWQKVKLGADREGRFLGGWHQAMNGTSTYEDFNEWITGVTRLIYHIPNLKTEGALVPLNLSTPTWMRGPGDCTGDFAIESAIDELSYVLNMDPVALRLKNTAIDKHPNNGLPWSTNYMNECIETGARMIGWEKRPSKPLQLLEGDWATGYGMAVGAWNAGRGYASAGIVMQKDGSVSVRTAMTDIGTGTGTGMRNIAHEVTGIPKNRITIELGHSSLPAAPSQGGSTGLSSVSGAVVAVSNDLKTRLAEYAAGINPAFQGLKADEVQLTDKGIALKTNPGAVVSYHQIWEKNDLKSLELEASSGPGEERQKFAFCSTSAHFAKLRVNRRTGRVKVEKYVCVADGGKIINAQAAANQMSGAVTGGIGMALMEEMLIDARVGGLIANDLAGYHFAVNADTPVIEVAFINKPDVNINPSGAKGLGEVGIIGVAAAITNAIYNATGKRLRDLPVTPDKIIA